MQERSGVDGAFLLVQLIACHLREDPENQVLLFASHHTAAHYIGAAQKLTFNARSYIETGKFQLVDVNAELYGKCPELEHTRLVTLLRNRVFDVPETSNTVVIVDDLSFYTIMDPGAEDSVIDFVEELISESQPGISHVVLKVNASECYERLCATLDDLATISILLEPLPSGNFREVDGRMTVHERKRTKEDRSSGLVLRKLRSNLLYKVGDRQVQTFVPGEFGIKNL